MSVTRSRANAPRENALNIYGAQLEAYTKKYMVSFDGSESLNDWASRHAQRFSTSVNNYVPLAVITRDMSEYVSKNKVMPTPTATSLNVTRYYLAKDEWSEGRSHFNKLLFSEFENWYSAFEAEADEDDSPDSESAASRWIYHCAKKLSRTGLSVPALIPVVEAWLNAHLDS